eukprot:235778_1
MAMNAVPSSVNPNFTPASLYVGDLNADVSEALLFEVFNSVGPVASIRVCRDVVTRRSLGYAYVNFHNVTDAERALDTMNFSSIRGRPCRIMWSQRDPSLRKSGVGNIFVKNLDKSIDHKTLYDTFSMFGNILSCKVATDEKGESLGYGFVHYETAEAAQKAIDKVNGMVIASLEVQVKPFKPKAERSGGDANGSFTNLYVKNFPSDFTAEMFAEAFEAFGAVTSSHLPADESGKLKGFGFVNFEEADCAQKAVETLHEKEPLNLYVVRAQKKMERIKELRSQFDKLRLAMAEKYAGVNLYVKNLADEVDDERLREEFKQFGDITSSKVMRDENGRSRGFGFVCFTKREEATKAVTDMNGKLLCEKPLYVALAQRKEIRRAHLEAQAQVNRQKMAGMAPMYPPGTPMMYPQQAAAMAMPRTPSGQFVYPQQAAMAMQQQQMQRGGWAPRGPQMQMRGAPQTPQVMPNMYMAGMANRTGGRVAGGVNPQGAGMKQQPAGMNGRGGVAAAQPQQTRIKFNENVHNPAGNGMGPATAAPHGGPTDGSHPPLNAGELAAAASQQQKQMIGERIFPLVQDRQPKLAGKITGMLLEMDNVELLHLLESPEALDAKIMEALEVLKAHDSQPGPGVPPTQQVVEAQ